MNQIKEIYRYREMIWMLVRRDLRGRYKSSVLGFLWTFLNPLLQLGVYTIVFSVIMRSDIEKYYLFLFIALIPWMFFSTSVQGGTTCVLSQKDMVTKIHFPRQVLPIAHVTTCFVNMLLCFIVVFLVCGFGIGLNFAVLPFLIPIMLTEYLLALGLCFIVSGATIYFRDLEHIMGIFVMLWQFLTPVMYAVEQVPEEIRPVFMMNPMTSIIMCYRDVLYYKQVPQLQNLLLSLALGILFLLLGWFLFDKLQRRFAEEL
ncbi:MAG: ABC transporter permease [Clostridia bacterium]|nr:ABC transporter permease [Clostridia bacterium]